jgi:hypothetical protein
MTEGFVDVKGQVEPRAIAGAIASDAHRRVAEAIVLTMTWLEEDDRRLTSSKRSSSSAR